MIPKKLRDFVIKLKESTETGELKWDEGASESYFCNHKAYTLYFSQFHDSETGDSGFKFQIDHKDKKAIFVVDSYEDDAYFMGNFWSAVTVSASDFDNIEDDFFS